MLTFYVGKAIRFAWDVLKTQPLLIGAAAAIITLQAFVFDAVLPGISFDDARGWDLSTISVVGTAVNIIVSFALYYLLTLLTIELHDNPTTPSLAALNRWGSFIPFTFGLVLYAIVVMLGTVAFIVPGIFFAIVYTFAYLFIVDKKIGVLAAFKESARLTKGSRWRVVGLFAAMISISLATMFLTGVFAGLGGAILGASRGSIEMSAQFVGSFIGSLVTVTFCVSFVHAYRVLTGGKKSDA